MAGKHVCPWWVGYFLMNPLRRFAHNPGKILAPLVGKGTTVLELGPGMGFFTIELARLVGSEGKVIAVDIQQRMLDAVRKRAAKAAVLDRIELRLAGEDDFWANGLAGKVDFALAFYMLHEVPDISKILAHIRSTLVPGGTLLIAEPKMHVSAREYADTVAAAEKAGFAGIDHPMIRRSRSILLEKS